MPSSDARPFNDSSVKSGTEAEGLTGLGDRANSAVCAPLLRLLLKVIDLLSGFVSRRDMRSISVASIARICRCSKGARPAPIRGWIDAGSVPQNLIEHARFRKRRDGPEDINLWSLLLGRSGSREGLVADYSEPARRALDRVGSIVGRKARGAGLDLPNRFGAP